MAERAYRDFDIRIRRLSSGAYRTEADVEGGHTEAEFKVPFDDAEREELRQIVQGPVREFGEPDGRTGNPMEYLDDMRKCGEQLYDALFAGDVRASLVSNCDWARQQADPCGVRIRLHLDDAPELADLPWEYLYDSHRQTFLVLRDFTPIVRHLKQPDPVVLPPLKPPINMLVMISNGGPPLEVEREWNRIQERLATLQERKLLSLTRVPAATVASLQECLILGGPYHIFHFIGHGGFRPDTRQPALGLDDGYLAADGLTTHLDPSSLRLVVLNSCDGARAGESDPFSALSHQLVKIGIPAVVAMQFKITDRAAIDFAGGLYGAIASNLSIEASVTKGRIAIYGKDNPTEWGTPVLFTRGKDGRLFSLDVPSQQQARQRQIETLARQARLAIDEKQYDMAIELLEKVKRLVKEMFAAAA
jgi:hypothetical protein